MFTWQAQGEANQYVICKDGNWFASILLNGEMLPATQENYISTITRNLNGE